MRLSGTVTKQGRFWAAEIPILGVFTQGRSRSDAFAMAADAVRELLDRPRLRVVVHPAGGDSFELSAGDPAALTALMLRRLRSRSGLTLAQVAERLDATSPNAWARYEQGRAVPTITKLSELFRAVAPGRDFVLTESRSID